MGSLRDPEGRSRGKEGKGAITKHPIIPDYVSYLKGQFREYHDVPLSVVLDSGNGTAGLAAPEVLRSMGCRVTELYSEHDGSFPNHHPDPTIPKNLDALISTVKKEHADFGVAFDGDADRIGLVDQQGAVLWGDQLMVLFSRDILADRPCTMTYAATAARPSCGRPAIRSSRQR
jgi:phosphomannomutase/phosphoglucomutase